MIVFSRRNNEPIFLKLNDITLACKEGYDIIMSSAIVLWNIFFIIWHNDIFCTVPMFSMFLRIT